ncbi:TonB-dependent receptor [Pontibacter diazotrophicus]|uniref:TonB-dependent receptor n=1 Tax=Pontibacter diazotrophicus TaxID=1400979 RepID=A0A3D8LIN0_9BACT|nr:TonB-dependent receptor [Pontibacter diazotrophicus]RDV17218.1 TonB-dependent receptor [Pontibacter diazotrophicus]
MNKLFFFVSLLLSLMSFAALAQGPANQLLIKGTLVDEQKNPVSYASVVLFAKQDSSMVSGATSDDAGRFEISTRPGAYYALVTFLSFDKKVIPDIRVTNQDVDLGMVQLTSNTEVLREVVVQGERSTMELSLDKKIFNVGTDLANAGGTAVNILSNVPSVAVDVEGNVSLRGSNNVRILIDGKPSGLVSMGGGSGLQQLQGNLIERVEVITNPSARYEAEGMAGIINIVLKKERKAGFNGSFDIITGYPSNFGAAANVNYRRKDLNFFVNYAAAYRNTPSNSTLYQELYENDTTFITRQTSENRQEGMNHSIRGGADYFFDEKNVLTGAYTWRLSKGKRYSNIIYRDYLFNTSNLQRIISRSQDETETEPNSEYSLTYKRTFAREGHELTADLRYLDNWEESDQYFTERAFLSDGSTPEAPVLLQRSLNDETEKQLLVQIDYVYPFGEEGKLEAGLRSSSRDMTNNYAVSEQTGSGVWSPLDSLNNSFLYEENIHAAYGIIGNKVNKFSYQVGLRAEWTDVTTTLRQTEEVNPRDYANLFPSAHITYQLPDQHSLQVSYSRRVRRPSYFDLSPFVTFTDRRNFFSGNPDLDPEFSNSFEVGHMKYFTRGSLSSSLYYRHTTGKVLRIRRVNEQGFSTTLPENLASENAYGAEFIGTYEPLRWWKLDGSFNFFRAITDGSNLDTDFQSDTYSWFSRVTSRVSFWDNADFQLRANYEAPQILPQGRRKALATLDLAVNKDILKNNGTLTLNVIDVFNSRRFRTITEGENFYTEIDSQGRRRQINLTFNYRLHQAKKQGRPIEQGDY